MELKGVGMAEVTEDVLSTQILVNLHHLHPHEVTEDVLSRDQPSFLYVLMHFPLPQYSARTECGYATVKDVRDHTLEDRMESFFLAETTKYVHNIVIHRI